MPVPVERLIAAIPDPLIRLALEALMATIQEQLTEIRDLVLGTRDDLTEAIGRVEADVAALQAAVGNPTPEAQALFDQIKTDLTGVRETLAALDPVKDVEPEPEPEPEPEV